MTLFEETLKKTIERYEICCQIALTFAELGGNSNFHSPLASLGGIKIRNYLLPEFDVLEEISGIDSYTFIIAGPQKLCEDACAFGYKAKQQKDFLSKTLRKITLTIKTKQSYALLNEKWLY